MVDRIETAFKCGYELGHSDTVESQYGDSDELAEEYIAEFKDGQLETDCHWGSVEAGEHYYETSCKNSFMINNGTPKENGFVFCPFCGKIIRE